MFCVCVAREDNTAAECKIFGALAKPRRCELHGFRICGFLSVAHAHRSRVHPFGVSHATSGSLEAADSKEARVQCLAHFSVTLAQKQHRVTDCVAAKLRISPVMSQLGKLGPPSASSTCRTLSCRAQAAGAVTNSRSESRAPQSRNFKNKENMSQCQKECSGFAQQETGTSSFPSTKAKVTPTKTKT